MWAKCLAQAHNTLTLQVSNLEFSTKSPVHWPSGCCVSLLLGEPVANVGTPHQMLTCQQSVNIKINCLSNTHSRSENSSIGNCQEGIAPLDISFATASTNPNSWAWMSESVSCSSTTGLHPSPPSSKKTKKRGFQIYLIIYLDLFKQILLRRERHSERKVS